MPRALRGHLRRRVVAHLGERPSAVVLGFRVDRLGLEETVARCRTLILRGEHAHHVSLNAAKLVRARDDGRLAEALGEADVVSPDGQSIVWASRLLGDPLPERVAGIDLMVRLLEMAEAERFGVFVLGAQSEVLQTALENLRRRFPRLRIAGRDGYFDATESQEICDGINAVAPQILFVAMSSPRKEYWVKDHRARLNAPLVVGVGGAIDVIAGSVGRAPRWVQRVGLEWLFRLLQEPRRLWRRYLVTNLRFVALLVGALMRRAFYRVHVATPPPAQLMHSPVDEGARESALSDLRASATPPAAETRPEEKEPSVTEELLSQVRAARQVPGNGHVGVAVLGAGPAGLAAAYVLARHNERGAVFEADGSVGGIAKTIEFNGYRFDLGGHRFFTKLQPIQRLWEEMLGEDFLIRPRLSRIYYNGKYFSYPITARDVVGRLGLRESALCAASYLWASRRHPDDAETFEEWVTARFGRRLYDAFFRSYTEKVWGIPGSEIRSLWAAQRIKNFSLGKAILSILGLRREHVTTLIDKFRYPRLGPGQMWEAFAAYASANGVPVRLKEHCIAVKHSDGHVDSIVLQSNGDVYEHSVDGVVSSIPLNELILSLDPPAPPAVREAARRLRYRDLVLVALMTAEAHPFPDNWIYLHDPETRAGRVQNYGAWSSAMVRPGTTCLGVEYFCFKGDEIWEMREEDAVALAKEELARIGLIDPDKVLDGVKVLVPKAYPMYDSGYEEALHIIRPYLAQFDNLQTCGRNGLHRYNNQDHSMWTAILAALNLIDGSTHDVWNVNLEAEYVEEGELVDGFIETGARLFADVEAPV